MSTFFSGHRRRASSLSSSVVFIIVLLCIQSSVHASPTAAAPGRERISINDGWRFWRSERNPDGIIYDTRPDLAYLTNATILKPWILPSGNDFIRNVSARHVRPPGNPGGNLAYVQAGFNDSSWQAVTLPHDYAIAGPFYTGDDPVIGGGMGRLPVQGTAWYRRKISKTPADRGKSIYLDIDSAMSYAMVWLNGYLVGGWPYGYNSFRLELTPYLRPGTENQLAIRLDNPVDSARWYPGGGIERNVWLTKVNPVRVAHWGTFVTTRNVSTASATVQLSVQIENRANVSRTVEVVTDVYTYDAKSDTQIQKVATLQQTTLDVQPAQTSTTNSSTLLTNPRLWGPLPDQQPNLYIAETTLLSDGAIVDTYRTQFGVRSLDYDPNHGLLVNGLRVPVQGTNNHHSLGAIGAAFNVRAAERQLEILQEMGCNALRTSHNPPAPEFLDLADRMGFIVLDEIFDSWYINKTANDFHLIFPDWHEQDLRAMIRRDRNHPSIVAWSYGNEVGEQGTGEAGAAVSQRLLGIVRQEDDTRMSTASINAARPGQPFPGVLDIISLNYQGAGIRDTTPYSNLSGIKVPPSYDLYHDTYPEKLIWGTETSSALSSRGSYLFPVIDAISGPVNDSSGGDSVLQQVSAYELYTADFGASPDKVFASQDRAPYVAGEFVWTGFDYLGEPTPYYTARSSYSGIVDLAGFKKDRFYLYQSHWRPGVRTAHILPHWTWPNRTGEVTPVHVFSAADEAELFLNGKSQGRLIKEAYTYRFRWDRVVYEPGQLDVTTYRNGSAWANASVQTTGPPAALRLTADRNSIKNDGYDLSHVTAEVVDAEGRVVPVADNWISFTVSGYGKVIATDNGNPADFTVFTSPARQAYFGLAIAIVKGLPGGDIPITLTAYAAGLSSAETVITLQ